MEVKRYIVSYILYINPTARKLITLIIIIIFIANKTLVGKAIQYNTTLIITFLNVFKYIFNIQLIIKLQSDFLNE